MKLLLTSAGIQNKSLEAAFLELLGKPFKECNLTFVPTAANPEVGDKTWLFNDLNNLRKLGFATLDLIDISAVPKNIWLPSFKKADVITFGGGNTKYLLEWMEKSGLRELLPEFLKTKIYMGISAGSRALTRGLIVSHEGDYKDVGLEYVDFSVIPHFNSKFFPERKEDHISEESKKVTYPVYAIDDNTGIKVVDDEVEIISEGEWKKFN